MTKLINFILDFLFPKFCEFCGIKGSYICLECEKTKFEYYQEHECHVCRKRCGEGYVHKSCTSKTDLDGAFYQLKYTANVKRILQQFKFNFYSSYVEDIARVLNRKFIKLSLQFDLLVAIPLHRKRSWERGFNQSELLIKALGYQASKCLIRIRNTPCQSNLKREERLINLKNAFKISENVRGKSILLVDDVITTGSTLEECAAVLKLHGARAVYGLCWARGE
ncbi:MAG: ComF family protein [bacterium]